MAILLQFIFRLSFGLALSMGLLPARLVPSGFFRVHLYVLLGLNALAGLLAWQRPELGPAWLPISIAVVSYFGSAIWLYEAPRPGKVAIWLVALGSLVATWLVAEPVTFDSGEWLRRLDPPTSGLVLGTTMAAMLLGHWYLNTPTMQLAPLRRLILWMFIAVTLRALVNGAGLALALNAGGLTGSELPFLTLRWLAGIAGTLVVAWMAWQTLKIPNTQSATGILYVGVIVTFIGELTSQLLSRQSPFPL